ncbi:MAG: Na/Pi cotransporter family protein [Clostridiales bacterium]|nr:Na/Pi cotransporter family protein [Roseburia sp.]MDD7636625.1 Na/Pi cotransporter family protein [Clostridiales bacterium]MDY4113735.1 Na/Pi cotransporter family protein [Roseburia sp.]
MDIFGILTLIGGLALFLYGMNVMGAGLEKMSGGKLERVLEKLTSSPIKAVLLGAGVTALIQSSSATTVMVVGFVNSGIMKLSQAIGIIMGANVGTTITAWLLSLTGIEGGSFFMQMLKPSSFAPILAMLGIVLIMGGKSEKKKDLGGILLGFTVLMTGMDMMSGAVKPLADVPEFTNILTMFDNPLLGVIAGALLTAVIQSSSASVGILQALSVTGAFTFNSVIPIVMGQNIGTCVTAMLSAVGANKGARRTAFVHLYFNLIGTILFLILYFGGNAIVGFAFADEVVGAAEIAMIHTIFNIFTTLALLPFTKTLEKLAYLTIPQTEDEVQVTDDVFAVLDERFLNSPAFAIEQCRTLVSQMAETTRDSFLEAMEVLSEYSQEKAEDVIRKENQVDAYNDKVGAYLTRLNGEDLSYSDSLQVTSLLHCITDFERISDHAINVIESAQQMQKEGGEFSKKGKEEITIYGKAIADILNRTTEAFIANDQALAHTVEPLEEVIDELNKVVKKHHMKRLRKGKCTIEMGLLLSDLAMNYERVADHCSNIAVYMMQLKDSQLEEHSFTEQMDEKESAEFTRLLEEFGKKYEL